MLYQCLNYVFSIFRKIRVIRLSARKNVGLFVIFLLVYYLCFPDLFSINLGFGMLTAFIAFTVIDIFLAAGADYMLSYFWFASTEYGLDLTQEASSDKDNSSGLANLIEADFRIIILILGCVTAFKFRNALLAMPAFGRIQVHFYYVFWYSSV